MQKPLRILVIGGGPAGLAAAFRLVDRYRGGVRVRLLTDTRVLGGRAASVRDAEGYTSDHGVHVFFGFYETLWSVLRMARVEALDQFTWCRGWSGVEGMANGRRTIPFWWPYLAGEAFEAGVWERILERVSTSRSPWRRQPDLEALDDMTLCEWAACDEIDGVPDDCALSQLSAFSALRSIQLLSRSLASDLYVPRSGASEVVWEPLGAALEGRGARVERETRVVGLDLEDDRVRAVQVCTAGGEETWLEDFDGVVLAVPRAALLALDTRGGTLRDLPALGSIGGLREAPAVTVQAFYDVPLANPRVGPVDGLGGPFPLVMDYQRVGGQLASDRRIRSTLSWCGPLAGLEAATDEDLLADAVRAASRAGFHGVDRVRPVRWKVNRDGRTDDGISLAEPGALSRRPPSDIGLRNLFLAGDWVRNRVDFPCMEGAAASGVQAADLLWRSCLREG